MSAVAVCGCNFDCMCVYFFGTAVASTSALFARCLLFILSLRSRVPPRIVSSKPVRADVQVVSGSGLSSTPYFFFV